MPTFTITYRAGHTLGVETTEASRASALSAEWRLVVFTPCRVGSAGARKRHRVSRARMSILNAASSGSREGARRGESAVGVWSTVRRNMKKRGTRVERAQPGFSTRNTRSPI